MSRDSPQMRSESSGLRLWGIEEEPACPLGNGSETSRTSVRWRPRISVANFSREAAIRAREPTYWAWRSRCTIWFDTGAGAMPSRRQTLSSMAGLTVA